MRQRLQYGLGKEEVILSKNRYGSNILTQKKRKSFFMNLLGNFGDPMIKVLMIALVINMVFLFGHSNWFESLGILAAILIAVVVSTISEYGSEAAFARLQNESQNVRVRVRREGKTLVVPVSELVVGDIVILNAGDRIPADGRILEGKIDVDQSALNGESKEARKEPLHGYGVKSIENRFSASGNDGGKSDFLSPELLFCATVVTAGEGVMEVISVGDNTFYGKLAAEVQESTPDSPLKQKLSALAKKISMYGYVGAAFVAFSYLFNIILIKNDFNGAKILEIVSDFRGMFSLIVSALTLAVTVIVMAVPEGLPMMITVALSSNMRRMLKDNVLVRKLNGIETAGSMNILFTDKTGTLTYGKPQVMCVLGFDALPLPLVAKSGAGFKSNQGKSERDAGDGLQRIVAASLIINNAAEMVGERAEGGNATDRALLEYAIKLDCDLKNITKISSIPFDSANKFMATRVRLPITWSGFNKGELTLIKGAPEKILANCTHCYDGEGRAKELKNTAALKKAIEEMSGQAARIIAIATSTLAVQNGQLAEGMTLVGLVAIRDRIRREAKKGVQQVREAGIQTVMITGDSRLTAIAIAKETGILSPQFEVSLAAGGRKGMGAADIVLTSEEMGGMSDKELKECLPRLRVVSRALPTDKSRLVKIAQSINLVAGMTGDGVNDAPALKKADIGFAMGSGTEVAKEAGDVVILDDNIMSISRAVSYGRTIFKSIRKFIIFQMSINFCAMAVSIIAPLIDVAMPITVIQMLWINLVIDTLAGLAFCGERPRVKYMKESPKRRDEPIINRYMWQQIITTGTFTALMSIWFLKSHIIGGLLAGKSAAYVNTAFFTMFMFMAVFNSFCARTHEIRLWDYLALNKQFIWIMGAIGAIQIVLIYFGGVLFDTRPLGLSHIMLAIGLSLSVIPLDIIRKIILNRGKNLGT